MQFDDAAGETAVGAAEVRVFDERREEAERVQVQVVEGVEDVGAYLKERALAHEAGQPRPLAEREVGAEVARPAERVAPDAGRAPAGLPLVPGSNAILCYSLI